jgi:uncharacterized NAD-dependent epimerase/dehydratase family protein
MDKAIVLTGGLFDTVHAKTAHGLVRGSERFEIVALIDSVSAGKDAGEVLDGQHRGIPIFTSLREFIASHTEVMVSWCIVGVATKGGVLPEPIKVELTDALNAGIGIVNGLHEPVSEIPELANLAAARGLEIVDIRKPKSFRELNFWSGRIKEVACPKIAVLGTDCALGKRTTARFLNKAMQQAGFKTEMIYTGQTGWMQGAKYGFIFDSTLNDFISGELEAAILDCWENEKPDMMFLEGQSGLRNPSGPCGAEFILSADAQGVILQHNPTRLKFKSLEQYPMDIPALEDEVELIERYGVKVIAVTLNTYLVSLEEARQFQRTYEEKLGIPVVLPLEDGVDRLIPLLKKMIVN